MKRLVIAALALVAVATPAVVDAWGNTGHRLIGIAAMRALPTAYHCDHSLKTQKWRG